MNTNQLSVALRILADNSQAMAAVTALAGVWSKSMGVASKQVNDGLSDAAKRLKDARDTLGVRPFGDIRGEIAQVKAAYQTLKDSGTASAAEVAQAWQRTIARTGELKGQMNGIAEQFGRIKTQVAEAGAAVLGLGLAVRQAAVFQSAIVDIDKVASLDGAGLARVKADIEALSRELPMTASGLAEIGKSAGQLNLPADQFKDYIRLVGQAATAFEMLPNEAGDAFGKLSNIYGGSLAELRLVGDSINKLADDIASVTERDLLNAAARAAPAAKQFGLTAQQLAALNAVLLSMGNAPEIAATSVNNLLAKLQSAPVQGDAFRQALKAIGIDARTLQKDIEKGPQAALISFLQTLRGLDASSRANVITKLFGEGGADNRAILTLVEGLDKYLGALGKVANASDYSGSIIRASDKENAKATSGWQLLKNAAEEFARKVGDELLKVLDPLARGLTAVVQAMTDMVKLAPGWVAAGAALGAFVLALAPLRLAAAGIRMAFALLAEGAGLLAGAMPVVGGALRAGAAALAGLAGPIGWALAGITALALAWPSLSAVVMDFGGVSATVGEVVSALWDIISTGAAAAWGGISSAFAPVAPFMAQVWASVSDTVGRTWSELIGLARTTGNFILGAFAAVGVGVAAVASFIVDRFKAAFRDVAAIVGALGKDAAAAMTGDFSAGNLKAAISGAITGAGKDIDGLRSAMSSAGKQFGRDFIGEAGVAIGAAVKRSREAKAELARETARGATAKRLAADAAAQKKETGGRYIDPAAITGDDGKGGKKGRKPADTGKSLAADVKAESDAAERLTEDALQRVRDAWKRLYDDGQVSAAAYYAADARLQQQAIDAKIAVLNRQRDAQAKLAGSGKDENERIRAGAEVKRLDADIEIARRNRAAVEVESARAAARAERELADQLAAVRLEMANTDGTATLAQRREALARQNEALIKRLKEAGNEAGAADVARLIDRKAMDEQMKGLETAMSPKLEALRTQEERIRISREAGMITEYQAQEQLNALRQGAIGDLEATVAQMERLAQAGGDAFGPQQQNQVEAMRNQVMSLRAGIVGWADKMRASVGDGLAGFFKDIITNSKTAGEAFRDFGKSVLASIAEIQSRRLAENLMTSLWPAMTGGSSRTTLQAASGMFGWEHHTGGIAGAGGRRVIADPSLWMAAPRYHSGGIAGLKPGEIPAILQAGEEVLTRDDPRHVANRSAAEMPPVTIEMHNHGTQQQVVSAQPRFDGRSMVISVVTQDLATNGPIAQSLTARMGMTR